MHPNYLLVILKQIPIKTFFRTLTFDQTIIAVTILNHLHSLRSMYIELKTLVPLTTVANITGLFKNLSIVLSTNLLLLNVLYSRFFSGQRKRVLAANSKITLKTKFTLDRQKHIFFYFIFQITEHIQAQLNAPQTVHEKP